MRILLSEGTSTSARQAVTALGLGGHQVEICDPNPHCLGRFSRYVRRYHRCPGIGLDAEGYLAFILDQLASRRFDVLLPIHEQGFLLSRVRDRISKHAAVALPTFESYQRVFDKAAFSSFLLALNLPQPATRIVTTQRQLLEVDRFPVVLKAAVATASRGTFIVNGPAELDRAVQALEHFGHLDCPVLVQDFAAGPLEHAQSVFANGHLVAFHAFRQIARGAGGGDAIKESIHQPAVRTHLTRMGAELNWHGALSVDYIVGPAGPLFIDCNPRLVEPMSAWFAGLDLTTVLIQVSRGKTPAVQPESRKGVRTHLAIQALLGCALRGANRWQILRECWGLLFKRSPYAGSREELTPLRFDWLSSIPAIVTALWLLVDPRAAHYLPQRGWGSHLLNPETIRRIRSWNADDLSY
jgi:predicted ATP-grasp superfamily ATP-dependent carboligase